jgi:hypothetical protein
VPRPETPRRLSVGVCVLSELAGIVLAFVVSSATVYSAPNVPSEVASPPTLDRFLGAARSAERVTITAEIAQMDAALKAYKERFGSYPPSDFSKLDDTESPQYKALLGHIEHTFPRCNGESEIAAIRKFGVKSPAQALFFWLRGFHADPVHPISGLVNEPNGNMPFFSFDKGRLKYPAGEKACPVYLPDGGGDAPYVFFSAVSYGKQAPFNADYKQGGRGIAKPYRADNADGGGFINPKSFQIISAGADGDYGGGKGSFPSGAGYEAGDKDNLANFSPRTLGDAIPR